VISEVNKGLDKIVTIEDPVEYQLTGVLQIPVNEKKGLTFARGLRSILRHDPDRIMVGEIRDPETAEIAVQSALTGHLVYTTVHANNVFEVIGRFMHMGVDTFNLVCALNAVMAQRLVRKLCTPCQAKGCAHCRGTGYRGRKAIAELMVLNDELRGLIVERAPTAKLKAAARATGTRTLREAALDLVARGETTMEEADRVTFVAS
jgi:general secretion pathway protein E